MLAVWGSVDVHVDCGLVPQSHISPAVGLNGCPQYRPQVWNTCEFSTMLAIALGAAKLLEHSGC